MNSNFARRRTDPVYEEEFDVVVVTEVPEHSRYEDSRSDGSGSVHARQEDPRDNSYKDADYSPKMIGLKYPAHDAHAPLYEGKDIAGWVAVAIIILGPFAAYNAGLGF